MKYKALAFGAVFLGVGSHIPAAEIPPTYIDSVVAIGGMFPSPPVKPGDQPHPLWGTEGTGFFYGYLVKDDPDPLKRQYEVYLVTAKHVVVDHMQTFPNSDLEVRVDANDTSKGAAEFSVSSKPGPDEWTWFYHPKADIDIAAVLVCVFRPSRASVPIQAGRRSGACRGGVKR